MLAQRFSIQIDARPVIRRAKVNKHSRIGRLVVGERATIPDRILVEHQLPALSIPVAGNIE